MWTCPRCTREFKNTNQSHYCQGKEKITTVDAYMAALDEGIRPLLEAVRRCIREAAPEATEKLAWQMPSYQQKGKYIIHFNAFNKHWGLYPGELSDLPFQDRLEKHRRTTERALQFPYDKPIDFELIADITRWRVLAVEGKDS